ncbi:amino acid transporter [Mycolicibacterium doricum]|uniref:Amino acid transporter n=1 Tax=Mycolicibacterium doricum TaxID=126673 RepID=A0A1X1T2T3_9MYCO|nr:LysE family transporter [Mycolicibacterium doricum]MCV7268644.1 LysE family transporter [Mycolicibacterium doricum]ORV38650.1 hypothetical protein AWC01_13900 [Mycolicibacterium doricum]BBZ06968.1 amino acid transporter [Mycolicibacterium doricum]
MTGTYLAGIALGLALIIPIGAQNVFVINEALKLGMPRALIPALTAAACDTLLIAIGAVGASALLSKVPGVKTTLLVFGAGFLLYLGIQSLRSHQPDDDQQVLVFKPIALIAKTIAVSLLNPHAILDTVGVIGTSIAAVPAATRPTFAAGTMTGSLLWFLAISALAATLSQWLNPKRRRYVDMASGVILLVFAAILAIEAIRVLTVG